MYSPSLFNPNLTYFVLFFSPFILPPFLSFNYSTILSLQLSLSFSHSHSLSLFFSLLLPFLPHLHPLSFWFFIPLFHDSIILEFHSHHPFSHAQSYPTPNFKPVMFWFLYVPTEMALFNKHFIGASQKSLMSIVNKEKAPTRENVRCKLLNRPLTQSQNWSLENLGKTSQA